MKKILLLLSFILLSFSSWSQSVYKEYKVVTVDTNISVPKFLVGVTTENKEDTLGVVFTIAQAQKIDNDLELLSLYNNMHNDCDSTVNFLVQVVDDYKKMNLVAQARFKGYESEIGDQKNQITNLKQQISIKEGELSIKDKVISDKNSEIKIDEHQIKQLKAQKTGLMIGSITVATGLFYMLIGHPGIR